MAHEQNAEFLHRLFVGWVPKHFTEKDLIPLFSQHGIVRDCIILKDKVTGQPRGAAFVSYGTREEAEAAIKALNNQQVHLPGALRPLEVSQPVVCLPCFNLGPQQVESLHTPLHEECQGNKKVAAVSPVVHQLPCIWAFLQVRFAKNHQFVQASEGPADNRQLFFSNAPASMSEEDLTSLFSSYGTVEEINLFRERKTGGSKGSGFVTMVTRDQAVRAMEALGGVSMQVRG
jgi:phosphoinositide-3-kinase regulatory subunit 4